MEMKRIVFGDNTDENNFGAPNKVVVETEVESTSSTPSAPAVDYSVFGVAAPGEDDEDEEDVYNSYQEKVSVVNSAFVAAQVAQTFGDTPSITPVVAPQSESRNVDIVTGEIIADVGLYEAEESYRQGTEYRAGTIVKMYGETQQLNYPHIHLESKDLPVFMVRTLKGMLDNTPQDGVDGLHVYLNSNGQLMEIGVLERKMLRSFLNNKVLGKLNASIFLSPETELKDDMMYAVCTLNS